MIQFRRIVSQITVVANIAIWIEIMTFALCLDNEGYEVSLELRKLYPVQPPESNDPAGYIPIIDESGEDYLYSAAAFEVIEFSTQLEQRLAATFK